MALACGTVKYKTQVRRTIKGTRGGRGGRGEREITKKNKKKMLLLLHRRNVAHMQVKMEEITQNGTNPHAYSTGNATSLCLTRGNP